MIQQKHGLLFYIHWNWSATLLRYTEHVRLTTTANMQNITKYVSLLFVVLWLYVAHADATRATKAIFVDAFTYSKYSPTEWEKNKNERTNEAPEFSCHVYSQWEIKYAFVCILFTFFFLSTAIILIATAAVKAHTVMQHTKQAQARKRYIQNGFSSDSCF